MARTKGRKANPEGRMALKEHIKELRNRLVVSGIAVLLGAVAGWFLYDPVMVAVQQPLMEISAEEGRRAEINYGSVGSPFDLKIQVSIFLGLLVSSPVWIYQIWAFITPGLKQKERRYTLGFMLAAVPLFLLGIYFGWIVLPEIVKVLTMFTPEGGVNQILATDYLTFVMRMFLSLGVAFLLPVVLVGINFAGLVSGKQVVKSWRIVVFVVCVVAAMAAPGPDATSMFLLAGPLLALFFVAVGICLLNDKRRARKRKEREEEVEASADTATPLKDLEGPAEA
ncbi:Sec-independent protein translocase TatC [Arthrobacter crystallopoietes BAB-32]|uniref:Sec-independent protein translocase protein TatC n=1 Tax=Arthrobacter crystallopoietes BAB-32 TaxID=1246476 RepID=N1V668_9MICC|nr:twin-arginine translocase subunit TatC [Arthrobacter crystallopoietes]EMY35602.1 Sec-independent protein translocase TatC [Arthrobacter crystallopoietes BAB-32]